VDRSVPRAPAGRLHCGVQDTLHAVPSYPILRPLQPAPHTPHLRAIIAPPHLYLAESKLTFSFFDSSTRAIAPGTRTGIYGLRAGLMVSVLIFVRRSCPRRWGLQRR
jgi:hypothetical protein